MPHWLQQYFGWSVHFNFLDQMSNGLLSSPDNSGVDQLYWLAYYNYLGHRVDPPTVKIGMALCSRFSVDRSAQEKVSEALNRVRKQSRLIRLAYGFRKAIDLPQVEEEVAFLAVCTALLTTYEVTYTALVLQKILFQSKAPNRSRLT